MTKIERARKQRQTPGTYRYRETHGIGDAGILKKLRDHRRDRSIADARDAALLVELQKKVEAFNGTTRNA